MVQKFLLAPVFWFERPAIWGRKNCRVLVGNSFPPISPPYAVINVFRSIGIPFAAKRRMQGLIHAACVPRRLTGTVSNWQFSRHRSAETRLFSTDIIRIGMERKR